MSQTISKKIIYLKIKNVIYYILGIIEVLLGLRLIFKLMGANPNNIIVKYLYDISGVLTKPFQGIFGKVAADSSQINSVFEPSILVAMIIYFLVVIGVMRLIEIVLFNESHK